MSALKAGRSDNETADKTPTGANNNENRHEIHDPGEIVEKIRLFKTGKPETFGQDKEEEIKQDENKETPGHQRMTQWGAVFFKPEIFKLAKLAEDIRESCGDPFTPAIVAGLFLPQEHVLQQLPYAVGKQ